MKLHKTGFGKSKLYPVCNLMRVMNNRYQSHKVLEELMQQNPKSRGTFSTLSTHNEIAGDTVQQ
ncbi:protein rep, partial [Staphylococcus aureus]